jgi:hypothetical protein
VVAENAEQDLDRKVGKVGHAEGEGVEDEVGGNRWLWTAEGRCNVGGECDALAGVLSGCRGLVATRERQRDEEETRWEGRAGACICGTFTIGRRVHTRVTTDVTQMQQPPECGW